MDEPFAPLPGEKLCVDFSLGANGESAAVLLYPGESPIPISFIISYYRIHATPSPDASVRVPNVSIPLRLVEGYTASTDGNFSTITVQTKHVWTFTFGFPTEAQFRPVLKTLGTLLAPTPLQALPAFDIGKALAKADAAAFPDLTEWTENAGWALYNQAAELKRQLTPFDSPSDADIPAALSDCGVGKDLRPWYRLTTLNQPTNSYGTFATYPAAGVVVPNLSSDDLLLKSSLFRSRARIPAISYVCFWTGAVLARCSQPLMRQSDAARHADATACLNLCNPYTEASTVPKVTLSDSAQSKQAPVAATPASSQPPPSLVTESSGTTPTSAAPAFIAPPSLMDEEWTNVPAPSNNTVTTNTSSQRVLNVVDLRPFAAATGNLAVGGGYESGNNYSTFCKVTFAGIDNIHGITASWLKLRQLINSTAGRNPKEKKQEFFKELHETNWYTHILRVLTAAVQIGDLLTTGQHVLTHCTDGWDRTSQATSLSMMLIDPFYRTVRGLAIIIEKEFCSFGHKFAERSSHDLPGETSGTAHISGGVSDVDRQQDQATHKKQTSFIFTQWLDCVYQIIQQFPTKFEFTPALLDFIGIHLFSCYFGTFLTNCNKERILEGVTTRTVSLWSEVERRIRLERQGTLNHPHRFLNPLFVEPPKEGSAAKMDYLRLSVGAKRLVFWEDLYLKYDSDLWLRGPSIEQRCFALLPPLSFDVSAAVWAAAVANRPAQQAADQAAYGERAPNVLRKESPEDAAAAAAGLSAPVDPKAKQCWKCLERFGMFRSSQACAACLRMHCSKCLFPSPTNAKAKVCASCRAMIDESE